MAPSYDRFTRWFSFGMDARWKGRLTRWVAEMVPSGGLVVDLACGTGDIGRAVGRMSGWESRVVGVDPSRAMLARAAVRSILREPTAQPLNRPTAQPLRLVTADMLSLPFRDRSAAAVTVGYGFRNVPSAERALAEVRRILRPGGWLFDLDFFLPAGRGWRRVFRWYLRRAGRLVGRAWVGEAEAYGYIDRSLEHWVTVGQFRQALAAAGFVTEREDVRLGGAIALHAARLVA